MNSPPFRAAAPCHPRVTCCRPSRAVPWHSRCSSGRSPSTSAPRSPSSLRCASSRSALGIRVGAAVAANHLAQEPAYNQTASRIQQRHARERDEMGLGRAATGPAQLVWRRRRRQLRPTERPGHPWARADLAQPALRGRCATLSVPNCTIRAYLGAGRLLVCSRTSQRLLPRGFQGSQRASTIGVGACLLR